MSIRIDAIKNKAAELSKYCQQNPHKVDRWESAALSDYRTALLRHKRGLRVQLVHKAS